jgi:regulator of replication initiation timing
MLMDRNLRKDIRDLKRMMSALKGSYKALLRLELEPLQKRLSKLEAQLARSRQ